MLQSNVQYHRPKPLSGWRKIAIGTWRTAGDPSVYGVLELPMTRALEHLEKLKAQNPERRITLTHLFGVAVARTIATHPEINCVLRFGKLYPRKSVDVFFQVASDTKGKDLSGVTIRKAEQKSIAQVAQDMEEKVHRVRKKGDPAYKQMKSLFSFIPGWFAPTLIRVSEIFAMLFNLWSPALGIPRDSFGSVMITNIGSLGLDFAFAPLVPYSRVPLLLAMGGVEERPVSIDGKIVSAPMLRVCCTIDHRVIDGIHASRLARTLKEFIENPERLDQDL